MNVGNVPRKAQLGDEPREPSNGNTHLGGHEELLGGRDGDALDAARLEHGAHVTVGDIVEDDQQRVLRGDDGHEPHDVGVREGAQQGRLLQEVLATGIVRGVLASFDLE